MIELPSPLRLVYKETTGSTNDDAMALAKAGAESFTFVWARQQTKGRGRHGRRWFSEAGNLYCSLILRLGHEAPPVEGLAFVAALAVAEVALAEVAPVRQIEIKWPNDVLIDGAKCSGILIERDSTADVAVVGVGINLEVGPDPGELSYPATTLRDAGATNLTVDALCIGFVRAFVHWHDIWRSAGLAGKVREAYLARMWRLGQSIDVSFNAAKDDRITGVNEGIDSRGRLLLRRSCGALTAVASADVLFPSKS